jgi:protoporphyrin/coproporphyrin ferrochelatase
MRYRDNLKNRELGKEAPLKLASGASDHCILQGTSEDAILGAKPTLPKLGVSDCLGILLVNFGGPRNLSEIEPFLTTLLCDPDVIPSCLPRWFFARIAKKRAKTIVHDYEMIGGSSPIYADTEETARQLSQKLQCPVLTFHRYLPATHEASLAAIAKAGPLKVLPLFPQFSYATTGSIARFFSRFPKDQLRWIKSYPSHPAFINAWQKKIAGFLQEHHLAEQEVAFLFSAHGLPRSFIEDGDIYERECRLSFDAVMQAFPNAIGQLAYQSKFGKGEWLRPYTNEMCENLSWSQNRRHIVIVPISFTSDHIETLFEIEQQYLPPLRKQHVTALRCPALNLEPYWISALAEIAKSEDLCNNRMLIR